MSQKTCSLSSYILDIGHEERVEVCVAIDTSGSVSEEMLCDFLSKIRSMMEQFTDFELHVWTFDTSVHNRQVFIPSTINELADYNIQGGGGTDFNVNCQYMKQEGIEPDRLIVMTDGYTWNGWGDEDYCDTIFLIHDDDFNKKPFTHFYDD